MRKSGTVLAAALIIATLPAVGQDAKHEPSYEDMVALSSSVCNAVDVRHIIIAQEHWPGMADVLARLARQPKNARLHNTVGNHYAELMLFDRARRAYECAVHLDPDLPQAWNNLGLVLLGAREHTQAIEALQRAIAADPNYAKAHYHLGVAYDEDGKYERALRSYEAAITLDPRLGRASYNPAVARNRHRVPLFLRRMRTEEAARFDLGVTED